MAPQRSRSRSTTTGPQRPPSRESTDSMHSAHSNLANPDAKPPIYAQPPTTNGQAFQLQHTATGPYNGMEAVQQYNRQAGVVDAAAQQQAQQALAHQPNQHPPMPPQMHQEYYVQAATYDSHSHGVAYGTSGPPVPQPANIAMMPVPAPSNLSMMQPQPSMMMQPGDMEPQAKDKKAGTASAANDRELRELLSKNTHRSLSDVATEVIATERTSRSEKTKQLFAMLWYVFGQTVIPASS